ncbi:MAG: hypothetical protein FD167_2045 [bacterium]|nr:MAG: hypothetical protein FD167_2045 [bacterium]
MENRKKNIEELQAELTLEAEALATLQLIYAEKVKQVRINTSLPPDIQARFLSEWETFYQQRMTAIFRKDYLLEKSHSNLENLPPMNKTSIPASTPVAIIPVPVGAMPSPSPVATVTPVSRPSVSPSPSMATSSNRPMAASSVSNTPAVISSTPVIPSRPIAQASHSDSTPVMALSVNQEPILTDDILGVDTGSWMNAAESIGYEQYSDSEPISSTLMDSDKIQSSNDSVSSAYDEELDDDESDSIDGFAATSGLKGLTEFMDFDLKRKKS